MENQRFEALSRICLNNWHYIKHRTLSFDDGINFFTGHSGSGKSTVIDAMQIVLYANTDGRGFFNKAAADKMYSGEKDPMDTPLGTKARNSPLWRSF